MWADGVRWLPQVDFISLQGLGSEARSESQEGTTGGEGGESGVSGLALWNGAHTQGKEKKPSEEAREMI